MPQTKDQRKASYLANKEARVAAVKDYQQRNRGKVLARRKAHRQENKTALAERNRQYREANKECLAEKAKERAAEIKAFIESIKETPCLDCSGEFPPCVMEIHHLVPRNGSQAKKNWLRWGKRKIEEELENCVVLCANCHRIRTYEGAP